MEGGERGVGVERSVRRGEGERERGRRDRVEREREREREREQLSHFNIDVYTCT